jgi:hypothetical protein
MLHYMKECWRAITIPFFTPPFIGPEDLLRIISADGSWLVCAPLRSPQLILDRRLLLVLSPQSPQSEIRYIGLRTAANQ